MGIVTISKVDRAGHLESRNRFPEPVVLSTTRRPLNIATLFANISAYFSARIRPPRADPLNYQGWPREVGTNVSWNNSKKFEWWKRSVVNFLSSLSTLDS